jgi:hypothetical protein
MTHASFSYFDIGPKPMKIKRVLVVAASSFNSAIPKILRKSLKALIYRMGAA